MPTEDFLMISQLMLNKHSGKLSEDTSRPLLKVLKEYLSGVCICYTFMVSLRQNWTQQILWCLFFSFPKNIFWSTLWNHNRGYKKNITLMIYFLGGS